MKAIVIIHNGSIIEDMLLAQIVHEIVAKSGATGNIVVNQLDDKETEQALVRTVAENANSPVSKDAEAAIIKGIAFIRTKYSDLIPSSKINSLKHIDELKIKLTARIITDCYNSTDEDAAMLRSCIKALSVVSSKHLQELGLPTMVIETINLIKPML